MRLKFSKMHGAGNDFMMLDLISQDYELDSNIIRHWGNRNTGIGFDQLLVVEPPGNPEVDFNYRIFNSDGSEAEQCGNGARCFARFVHDQQLCHKQSLVLETISGRMRTLRRPDGVIEVDMGAPGLHDAYSDKVSCNPVSETLSINSLDVTFTRISMGNPHAIIFVDDVVQANLESIGPALSTHPFFPDGVNVGFAEIVDPGFMRLRVFERGAGETLACGSGACAAVVAGILHKKLNNKVKVSLPGGKLRVSWPDKEASVVLAGQARKVFEASVQV